MALKPLLLDQIKPNAKAFKEAKKTGRLEAYWIEIGESHIMAFCEDHISLLLSSPFESLRACAAR